MAQDMITKENNLAQLASKSAAELIKTSGIGKDKAATLLAVFEISRRILSQAKWFSQKKITSPSDVADIFIPLLRDELKEQFKNQNPQAIILDIEKFAKNILLINSNDNDKQISMLKYLRQSIYWKSILATAMQVDYQSIEELKKLITKYYYQSWIANGTSNRIKQTSFNILNIISCFFAESK
jgi:hypothetical protein